MTEEKREEVFDFFPKLASSRLELIEIKEIHKTNIFDLYSDTLVTEYFDLLPLQSLVDAEKEIRFYQSRFQNKTGIRWGISLKGEPGIIGTLGFNRISVEHKAKIGYDLLPKYWGKGYMSEALATVISFGFDNLSIERIEAEVMQGNIRSEKLLTKLHFQKEGILRKWMFWNGRYYDMSMFSLLLEDNR